MRMAGAMQAEGTQHAGDTSAENSIDLAYDEGGLQGWGQ